MNSTVVYRSQSFTVDEAPARPSIDLMARYRTIVANERMRWTAHHRMQRKLGEGGQGVVYLSRRFGADNFTLPVAMKIFSPQNYRDADEYNEDMGRIAHVSARVAQIQHDHLLDIHNFIEQDRIRIMEMEWIDGYDLQKLLTQEILDHSRSRISPERWAYLSNVLVSPGPAQPRFKPGVAIQVLRECLAGVAALHREGIVHGDLKPANIMLKRTGNAKVIDIGAAIDLSFSQPRRMFSPAYAAPEVLDGGDNSPQADLASLGYVLIEMLAGRQPFAGLTTREQLADAKRQLFARLPKILPPDVVCNKLLLNLCRGLTEPDPSRRIQSAEAADMNREGAAEFHRQLVKVGLASEYENDIRVWLEQLE